ncbi:MAG TPA: hypothetical protein VFT06_13955 [Flavisolibacter sp.]|nr:hypothetical protein [Flavisolibacter sp.]
MNDKTTYEITIAEKLQQLPLPNLEDAIWARVKERLDLDLPTDDGGDGGPDAPDGSGWSWGAGVFLFVAAIVAVFFLRKNETQQPSPSAPVQNPTTISSPAQQPAADSTQTRRDLSTSPAQTTRPGDQPVDAAHSPPGDSVSLASLPVLPSVDSQQRTTLVLPPPIPADTTKPKPKTKGVRGLTDADYRIVPAGRDST